MKLLTAVAASFAGVALAGQNAAIYSFSSSSSSVSQSAPKLSLVNARLILADQLGFGLPESHNLDSADDDTLRLLQTSSQQQLLFAAREQKSKTLLFVEGVKNVKDIFQKIKGQRQPLADLEEVPRTGLNQDFVKQLLGLGSAAKACEDVSGETVGVIVGGQRSSKDDSCTINSFDIAAELSTSPKTQDTLSTYHILLPRGKQQHKDATAWLAAQIGHNVRQNLDLIVIVVPAEASYSKDANWGKAMLKRSEEAPMISILGDAAPTRPVLPVASGNHSVANVNTTMKVCSTSEDSCNARTNSCSGHGKCKRKFKNDSGECWRCVCSKTKEKWGASYWGGPACQKQDISVQFWLFASFAIFGTGAVTWGIGLLYSMGSQQLPSVLSAGVAPTNRK